MRTTIRLDDQLLREVKKLANEKGQSMTAVIEESLRLMLARREQMTVEPPVKLITVSGNGLQAGVDLNDSAAMLNLMGELDKSAY
jgi:hypothetical protein